MWSRIHHAANRTVTHCGVWVKKSERVIQIFICALCKSSSKSFRSSQLWKFSSCVIVLGNWKNLFLLFIILKRFMGGKCWRLLNIIVKRLSQIQWRVHFEAVHREKTNFEKLIPTLKYYEIQKKMWTQEDQSNFALCWGYFPFLN